MKSPVRCHSPSSLCSDFCSCVGVSLLSAPRANKKRNGSRLSRQHGSHTHTHTHAQVICVVFRVHTRSDMCGEYVTVALLAAWVSVCRPELRNLSRLQLMSGNLKLAAHHKLYLYSTVSLVSRLVSYFNTDFGNDVLEQRVQCYTRNRIYIELTLIYLCVSY